MTIKTENRGFTLIELAAVIIIIGLLVGGVMQGQELVKKAQIQAQIKQFEEYDVAALGFKTKTGFLPGDITTTLAVTFGVSATNFNTQGNGRIDDNNGVTPNLAAYPESYNYFTHLSQLNFIKDYLRPGGSNDYTIGQFMPFSKLGNKTNAIAVTGMLDGVYYFLGATIRRSGTNGYFNSISTFPPIIPEDAFSMDIKIDDGIPSQGFIRAVIVSNSAATNLTNDTNLNNCLGATNQVYNLTTSNTLCRLVVKAKVD